MAIAAVPTYASKAQSHLRILKGIRYGVAERFAAPLAVPFVAPSAGAFASFGPACPQAGNRYLPASEDCLFLNLWAPKAKQPRPVMVYFHGGAYSTGSVTDPVNDGAALATHGDVVVVTVNHRLNAFGYLYVPERFPDSGNAGQLDLILALQWIQAHIAEFGGDPKNVTVFGQSGGGAKGHYDERPASDRDWPLERRKARGRASGGIERARPCNSFGRTVGRGLVGARSDIGRRRVYGARARYASFAPASILARRCAAIIGYSHDVGEYGAGIAGILRAECQAIDWA
jgi:hypothetical protein